MRRALTLHAALLALALCMSTAPRAAVDADPNFNGGLHFVDRFSGSGSDNFVGDKIVRRTNGEVIVAGRVSWGTQTNPDSRMNLGVVRYSRDGTRLTWGSGADTAYTLYGRQYLVYPKASSLFRAVRDVAVLGGFVHVLADRDGTGGCGSFCERDVSIVTFRLDNGELVGVTTVFATGIDEYSAGLVPVEAGFGTARLLVVGTRADPGRARPIFKQFVMNAGSGVLTPSPDFATGPDGYHELAFPASMCAPADCDVTADQIAWYGGGFIPLGIYVGGRDYNHNDARDYFIARVNLSGVGVPGFGVDGVTHFPIDSGNTEIENPYWPGGIVAMTAAWGGIGGEDSLYFLATNGGTFVFVARVLADGSHDLEFGRVGFGFANSGLTVGRALDLVGDTLYAVGQARDGTGGDAPIDAAVARIPTDLSYVQPQQWPPLPDVTRLPPRRADGSRIGEAIFNGMAFDPDGAGLWVGGSTIDDAAGGTRMFDTLHVCIAIECRRLFGDGLEDTP